MPLQILAAVACVCQYSCAQQGYKNCSRQLKSVLCLQLKGQPWMRVCETSLAPLQVLQQLAAEIIKHAPQPQSYRIAAGHQAAQVR